MTVVAWLLLIVSYDHMVQTATYPTESACEAAKSEAPPNTQDLICVPAVEVAK